jgi:bifunctional DNase/RNase
VFYSIIKLFDGKKVVEVDSRTSDAIALAVRFKCKIYVDDEVIKQTAMEEEMNSDDILVNEELDDDKMTIEELEDYLEELIKQENYEEASKIRDEIKRIKEEGY